MAPDLGGSALDQEQTSSGEGQDSLSSEPHVEPLYAAPDLDAGFEDAVVSLQQTLSILHAPPAIVGPSSSFKEPETPEKQKQVQIEEPSPLDAMIAFQAPLAELSRCCALMQPGSNDGLLPGDAASTMSPLDSGDSGESDRN